MSTTSHERIALKVLDNWPGTPEELGADLTIASREIELIDIFASPLLKASVRRRNEERISARLRILSVDGGDELLKLESQLLRSSSW